VTASNTPPTTDLATTKLSRRQFALISGGAMFSFGIPAIEPVMAAAAPAAAVNPASLVDEELKPLLEYFGQRSATPMTLETLPAMREAKFEFPLLPTPAWSERMIPGPAGAPDVHVYIINADAKRPGRPAILYIHGGGFVLGDAKSSLHRIQEMCQSLDCVVVSVDYRLAPEVRFPGALEDNYAGLKWLYLHAAELGADSNRIAVMGESAGGGHAAMLAIAARDRGEIKLVYQSLIYPMLDDRTGSTRKVPAHIGTYMWTAANNRFGWTSLLGVPAGSAKVPYGAVPARIENLAGLPPTFIGVGSLDLFVDEDVSYAQRLINSGVPVELRVVPGAMHGFDVVPTAAISITFKAAVTDGLKRAFKTKT
jgi:acetyl esterase/lipase